MTRLTTIRIPPRAAVAARFGIARYKLPVILIEGLDLKVPHAE